MTGNILQDGGGLHDDVALRHVLMVYSATQSQSDPHTIILWLEAVDCEIQQRRVLIELVHKSLVPFTNLGLLLLFLS